MTAIYIERVRVFDIDSSYIGVDCSESVKMELRQYFSFMAAGAKYDKRYRNKLWDGKIYLFDVRSRKILSGLKGEIEAYCKKNHYEFIDDCVKVEGKIDDKVIGKFIEYLNLPTEMADLPFEIRDYQIETLKIAIRDQRAVILSPTSSGKSLSMYLIARWFNKRTLIIVPTTTLVTQLAGDFASYNYQLPVSQIMAGQSKVNLHKITVSTWQSVKTMPPSWLAQFEVIIGDEAHGFEAKSLQKIMTSATAKIRIGTTGTIKTDGDQKVHRLTLIGLFGNITRVLSTTEMIENGWATPFDIIACELLYDKEDCKAVKPKRINKVLQKVEYSDEMDFICNHKKRNHFLKQLALSRKGNTLLLFKKIEHGKELYRIIKELRPNTHLVYGNVKTEVRNEIRALSEKSNDAIIIASYPTFSTGINIRNLHHVILAAPIKSQIKIVQSIGRLLRLNKDKDKAHLYDVGDNLMLGAYTNFAYKHFISRLELYTAEKFDYKIKRFEL